MEMDIGDDQTYIGSSSPGSPIKKEASASISQLVRMLYLTINEQP
jgi:hypothetical protein